MPSLNNARVVIAVALVANLACGHPAPQAPIAAVSIDPPPPTAAPPRANRLALEKSPYLLAHAKNPVDWYPWSEEAFDRAKREGKPVFLSIGYSTCHWCHVMERESFEDPEIAAYLNENYISVKVDREERPDVDAIYIEYVRARTGGAGWPLTAVLTADRHPFFGGTYFPPRNVDEPGRSLPGLLELLKVIAEDWKTHRAEIEQGANSVAEALVAAANAAKPRDWGFDAHSTIAAQRIAQWKTERASGASAPRFPEPMMIDLLIEREVETGDAECLSAATDLLDELLRGGIFDPIGGGFARYSVDERFLVPHFEKMLYVNALLARTYALAFQRTRDERYADVVRMTLEYLLRDMRVEEAAFATAEDADSLDEKGELVEGLFYTFTPTEIRSALPSDLANTAIAAFCLEENGHLDGRSVPNRLCSREFDDKKFELARRALFDLRAERTRPLRDDKVLAGENGLAISAFAFAGRVLREPRYLDAAREARDFVRAKLVDEDSGVVLRRYRAGESALVGQLSDYAYLAQGLLDLYSATFDPSDLELAIRIVDQSLVRFYDGRTGILYDAPKDSSDLIVRTRDAFDGALPSATSIIVRNLVRIARLTGRQELEEIARRCLDLYADEVERTPLAYPSLIAAEHLLGSSSKEAVFAGPLRSAALEALVDAFYAKPRPGYVIAHASPDAAETLGELIEGRIDVPSGATTARAYLCRDRVCSSPISEPREFP